MVHYEVLLLLKLKECPNVVSIERVIDSNEKWIFSSIYKQNKVSI